MNWTSLCTLVTLLTFGNTELVSILPTDAVPTRSAEPVFVPHRDNAGTGQKHTAATADEHGSCGACEATEKPGFYSRRYRILTSNSS